MTAVAEGVGWIEAVGSKTLLVWAPFNDLARSKEEKSMGPRTITVIVE